MSSTIKRILALVAAAALLGVTFSNALAQDDGGAAAEPAAGDAQPAGDV